MSLGKQATSLGLMHAADVLQPILVLLYAGKIFEPVHFGQFAYALSISQIAVTVVDYGFHWTAQRAAAVMKQNPARVASLLAEVIATKALLFVLLIGGMSGLFLGLHLVNATIMVAAILATAGTILFTPWLFIALERAWQAAAAVVVSRIVALVGFVALIKSPSQLPLAVALQASIPLIAALVALPFVFSVGFGGFRSVTLADIGAQLREGWRGFLYTLVDRALVSLPVPLVEHFGGYVAAGQYSIAEKFLSATKPVFRVILETFLPKVAHAAHHDPASGLALVRMSFLTLIAGAGLSLSLYYLAPILIIVLFGQGFVGAIPIVRAMAVLPLLINVNLCTAGLFMFNFGHERAWAALTVAGLIVFLAAAYLLHLVLVSAGLTVALALVSRESLVLAVSTAFYVFYRTKISSDTNRSGGGRTGGSEAGATISPRAPALAFSHPPVQSKH